jgi:hypothetical protein
MTTFLSTGVYTQGCIVPVTTEDPCLTAILDDFSEKFRVNIYVGDSFIDCVTIKNYRQMCNNVSSIPVVDRFGAYQGTIWSLVNEHLYYSYLRIHGNEPVKGLFCLMHQSGFPRTSRCNNGKYRVYL